LPIPPFGKPPKQKTSRALEPFWPVRRKQGLRRYDPGCKQPKPPAPELRTTAGSRRRNDCPLHRAGQPPPGRATDPRKARLTVNEASAGARWRQKRQNR